VDGHPASAFGINSVGLDRAGYSREEKANLKKAFKIIFRSGLILKNVIKELAQQIPASPSVDELTRFLGKSERGICG